MVKVTLLSLIGVGALGTNAPSLTPQSVELNAGAIVISVDSEGIKTEVTDNSDFAVRIKTKKGRVIAIRF